MSYQRVIHRNGLETGGYTDAGKWSFTPATGLKDVADHLRIVSEDHVRRYYDDRLEKFEVDMRLLLGDLRRLEHDTLDEGAMCAHIAERTGIDPDTVAAVLAEFMRW